MKPKVAKGKAAADGQASYFIHGELLNHLSCCLFYRSIGLKTHIPVIHFFVKLIAFEAICDYFELIALDNSLLFSLFKLKL